MSPGQPSSSARSFIRVILSANSFKHWSDRRSHLRFGPEPIKGEYEIQTDCDYIACHNDTYVHKFDMLKPIKQGGTFVLNWGWGEDQLDARLPNKLKEQIANGELEFYTVSPQCRHSLCLYFASFALSIPCSSSRSNDMNCRLFCSLNAVYGRRSTPPRSPWTPVWASVSTWSCR